MQIPKSLFLMAAGLALSFPSVAQFFSGRINVAGWGAGVINVAVEMEMDEHWSVDLPVYYSPFHKSLYRMGGVMLQPGLKYWLIKPHARSFLCLSATMASFNIYRSDARHKWGFWSGAGLSYGYSHPLTKRLNLVAEAGLGFYRANIHKRPYQVDYTEDEYVHRIRRWYLAPSRIELSISYLF